MNVVPIKSLYNHLLASFSFALSRYGLEYTAPMPVFISIEPSSICQLRCPQCPCGAGTTHRTGEVMTLETFHKILKDCQGWVHTFQFYFQGEPLLNPRLSEMILLAHQAHIYTICSTNAQVLTPLLAEQLINAGLDHIIVSIDGLSEFSYSTYRVGGSLNQALKGLIYLREAKDRLNASVHIELQCLRLRSNEHEWAMFRRSYRQMGADSLTLKTAQLYDYKYGNPLMPTDETYCRYVQNNDGIYVPKNRIKGMLNRSCKRLMTGCVIAVNGDVLPCCFDKSASHVMGNIHTATLGKIWHGEAFQTFRRQVKNDRMVFPICTNCTED